MAETRLAQQAAESNGNKGEPSTQSNELFRLLVETVKDYAIFVLDPEGHILTWNDGAQAIKGYSKAEIVGQHFSKFYLPEAVESGYPRANLRAGRGDGNVSLARAGASVKDGSVLFWASVIITPLRDR